MPPEEVRLKGLEAMIDITDINTIASAVFQGSLALFGVIGIFVIYRLQEQRQLIQQKIERAATYARDAFMSHVGSPIPVAGDSAQNVRESIHTWAIKSETEIQHMRSTGFNGGGVVQKAKDLENDRVLQRMLDEAEVADRARAILRRQSLFPFLELIVLCGLSLLLMTNPTMLDCVRFNVECFGIVSWLVTMAILSHIVHFVYRLLRP